MRNDSRLFPVLMIVTALFILAYYGVKDLDAENKSRGWNTVQIKTSYPTVAVMERK